MHKFSAFLLGCGLVGLVAMLLKPLGLQSLVGGIGILAVAYIVFYPPN
jgi:hypothetical protein